MSNHGFHLSRRGFFATAGAGVAANVGGSAYAATPPKRHSGPHMKLSLAAYSFNRQMARRAPDEARREAEMTLEKFIDFCAELNLDACEPTAYYFPAEVTQDFLLGIKEQTFRLGLDISGTAIGNDFCLPEGDAREEQLRMTREWIDHAAFMGAPVIRIFAGNVPKGDTEAAALERCVAGINESLDYAAQKGVVLALENHGGITATPETMLRIIENVQESPWFGVNFDSGNFNTDDPYRDLAMIAPYTVNAQLKVMMRPNGGREPADFGRIIGILREADYRGYLVLEYEEDEDPKEAIPRHIEAIRKALEA